MSKCEVFIGRDIPKDEFWSKYTELSLKPSEEEKIYAMSFYGIGGMGKSYLIKKLMEELDDEYGTPKYIDIDLKSRTDCITILKKIAMELCHKYKYKFPLFVYAYNTYVKKIGESSAGIDFEGSKEPGFKVQKLIEIGIDLAGKKTIYDSVMLGIELAKLRNTHKEDTDAIEELDANELYEKIPYYFALDMNNNSEVGERPLIVFIDTYENFVSEVSLDGNPLSADKWLRAEDGILKKVPNVFWVICGRERLKWENYSENWADDLIQHKLKGFDEEESDEYLKLSGFEDASLRKKLSELTNGNPFYLSLCKKQLDLILERGETPDISLFGNNTEDLFDRYVRNMKTETKDLLCFLSALHKWNDELVYKSIGFSETSTYESLKSLSYTEETGDGFYTINRTVSEVMMKNCHDNIKKVAGNLLLENNLEIVKSKDYNSKSYSNSISAVLRAGVLLNKTREEVYNFFVKEVKTALYGFIKTRFHKIDFSEFHHFLSYAWEKNDDLLFAEATKCYCSFLFYTGQFKEAMGKMKITIGVFETLLGVDDDETLRAKELLANIMESMNENEEAIAIQEEVYKSFESKCGEIDSTTLSAMNEYAGSLQKAGKIDEALEYFLKIYETSNQYYGEDHPDTIIYMHNYAHALHDCGRYNEARRIKEKAIKKQEEINPNHPYTLHALYSYALTLDKLGDHQSAIKTYLDMLNRAEGVMEQFNPLIIAAKSSLAVAYGRLKDFSRALHLLDDVIETGKKHLDVCHPDTLCAMNNKACLLYELERYEEAESYQSDVIRLRKENLGDDHATSLSAMMTMALIQSKLHKKEEAIENQQKAVDKAFTILGAKHPFTLELMRSSAVVCQNLGDFKTGYKILTDALPKFESVFGINSPYTKEIATGVLFMLVHRKDVPVSKIQNEVARLTRKFNLK